MSLSPMSLDEFKARLPLVDIVARYVRLVRRGREHVGLCPFHKEKTPSFSVVEDKGFYHCFGCGAHGNAIDFVMAIERCDFPEAIERLASLTGLEPPRRRREDGPRPDGSLYEACAAAASWFARQLEGASGAAARDYLARRGVDMATARRFGLGWAPADRRALKHALAGHGLAEDLLVRAGLLVVPESGESYDRFRERLIFPIHDARGRVVGFGGRAMGEAKPKYLNGPDTELFHKGRLLYNLAGAARPARAAGTVVVAEGYMDVIALAQAGFAHAVAPLGTAVTEEQLQALWRLADEPILCLDGDEAGARAALRAAERALPLLRAGKSLRFALLPAGEDPDSLLRQHGPQAVAASLAAPLSLVDFLWQRETAGRALDTPERRAAFQARCRELLGRIVDAEVRRHYYAIFRERLEAMWPRRQGNRPGGRAGAGAAPPVPGTAGWSLRRDRPEEQVQRRLLRPVLEDPSLLREGEEELAAIELPHRGLDALRWEILHWYGLTASLDALELRNHLTRYGFGRLLDQVLADAAFTRAHSSMLSRSLRETWIESLRAYRRSRGVDMGDPGGRPNR